jgi:peroxiredoxin
MSAARTQETAASRQADTDAELAVAASSEAASRALRAGSRAPIFTLVDVAGRQVSLEDLLSEGPVILHFFRGTWCSFGRQSLMEFATIYEDVVALGASAVAIAPPCERPTQSEPLPIRELRDIDMKVSRAYGLAFELPAALRPGYEESGYTPPSTRKAGSWLVPLPATYLLDRDGVVALSFIDVDYRNHFESESLLTALKALQARHAARSRASPSTLTAF